MTANTVSRDIQYTALIEKAHNAGLAAGNAVTPTPMNLVHRGPDGDKHYHIPEGPCGFAWIKVKPATSSFARWLRKNEESVSQRIGCGIHQGYPTGLDIWVRHFDQSHQRKVGYARAFAEVLRAAGFNAYPGDRLD